MSLVFSLILSVNYKSKLRLAYPFRNGRILLCGVHLQEHICLLIFDGFVLRKIANFGHIIFLFLFFSFFSFIFFPRILFLGTPAIALGGV